ncbi:MAG: PQQ-binding-like beta-propeller repeat protein [Methanomicrobiaceae archaeon]|nr:PQQ-binding-like beta-propeller repeat protein [Methanomicrobiaceae archaeon]
MHVFTKIPLLLLILALCLAGGAMAQDNQTENDSVVPPEVSEYAGDWPLPNYDYANTRATNTTAINASSINDLGVAWSFALNASGQFGAASSNPIITGDTVYFQDINANVFALSLETGDVVWTALYNNTSVAGPNGPAVGWGKVFAAVDPYTMGALDAATGEELWTQRLAGRPGEGIDIAPTVYDGMVYTSTVPGLGDIFYAGGNIGIIFALDEENGTIVWNFSTVDDPESIWGNPEVNSGGGVWYTPAVDTGTGITYWGVANPAPFAGTPEYPNGASRPGPNLYTNSMLALGHDDGELIWFTQVLPHDLFDHDFQIPPILTNANVSGTEQEIVLGAGKMGRVYAFNRDTGAILWVTVVGRHENDQLAALPPGTTTVYPGALGGVETPMAAADGAVYVPYVDLATNWTPESSLSVGANQTGPQPEFAPFEEGTGGLVAIETDTGKILWEQTFDSINVGGATVINDLVLTATFDGAVYAFNRTSGEEIWTWNAPAGINAWPAVANDTILIPAGVGEEPALIALRLGANVTPPAPEPTPEETEPEPTMPVAEPMLAVLSPAEGDSVDAGNVTVEVEVTDFALVEPTGQDNVPGEGHLHYYLDALPLDDPDEPAIPEAGEYAVSIDTSYTWENVTPGEHVLAVQLVNNDHTPLVPVVAGVINVTVAEAPATEEPTEAPTPEVTETPEPTPEETETPEEPTPEETETPEPTIPEAAPMLAVLSPAEGDSVDAGNVTVEVEVTDFTLVEPTGQDNVPGEGHLHYYLDALPLDDPDEPAIPEAGEYAVSIDTSYTWENVTPGEHVLAVQLVNNDHTPLVPVVAGVINVTATGEMENGEAETVTIDLVADDIEFDTDTITVPAGAEVTVNFDNRDALPHNLAVYENTSGMNPIFVGEIFTGPEEMTYTFTAPEEPGTYFFRCDVHPRTMTGDFIVE